METPDFTKKTEQLSHMALTLAPVGKARLLLFKRLLFSVWVILVFYAFLYWKIEAQLSLWAVLLGVFILSPLNYYLEIKKHHISARFLFILSCNLYIYFTSLGLSHQVDAEHYYLPASMIALLIFDLSNRKEIIISIAVSLFFWILSLVVESENLMPGPLPAQHIISALRVINFAGSFIVLLIFAWIFIKTTFHIRDLLVSEVTQETTKLQNIMNTLSEGLVIQDKNGKILSHNPAALDVLELSSNQLCGKSSLDPDWQCVKPDGLPYPGEEHPSMIALKTKKPVIGALMGINFKDKRQKWISINAVPFDLNNTENQVIVTFSDITQIKNADRRNKLIINALGASALVSYTDTNGIITEVNDQFCQISGYGKSELIGKTHRVLNSGKQSEIFFKEIWNTILARDTWVGNICNRSKSGSLFFLHMVITPITDANGNIKQFMSISFDVTEQKKIENQLLEAQIISKIGSWHYDFQTGKQNWSSEHYRIFEIPEPQESEILYKMYRDRIHPEDQPALDNFVSRAAEFGEDFTFDHRVYLDEGKRIKYVQGIAKVTKDSNGNPIYISGTCQDRTQQYLLENSLQVERAKAIHSSKLASLGELSAGIAHEINNPLAIVSGSVQTLSRFRENEDKFNDKINVIQKACYRMEKIVTGLRKFSRTNEINDFKNQCLDRIVKESLVLTESRAKKEGISISTDLNITTPVYADEIEIEQVLVNLINNAIDAIKINSEKWIKIHGQETENSIVLKVIDSGHGISKEMEEKLFQPFFTTKPVGEGTGLGLSISKGILDQHNAQIFVNREHANTCFEIHFPKSNQADL
jgi:PAS domain S-box-containing protein